ncbi:major facilitator superfamily domain-containing protein [Trichoderma chlorosporum]
MAYIDWLYRYFFSEKEEEKDSGADQPRSDRSEIAVDRSAFQVGWDEDDPLDPKNWSSLLKLWMTFVMGLLAFTGSVGSAIMSPAEEALAEHFGISTEVTVLTMSLFILGFALGPVFWAPISEAYGRKWSMLPAVFVLGLFSIGSATCDTVAGLLITRFLGGVFGSAPVSNVAAALGDFYTAEHRGTAMSFYAICVVGGPTLAPLIGTAITANPHMGWRWTEYIEAIIAFFASTTALITLPETYGPVLLERKAKRIRKATGDERWWHPHENERIHLSNVITKHLSRPLRMLFTEPIVSCVALYASFVYSLMFLMLEVFPIVFRQNRDFSPIVAGLPFLGLFVGVLLASCINIAFQPMYIKAVQNNRGRAVPEARSPPMIIGGALFTIGMFWFGWTAKPSDSWVLPVVASSFISCGFTVVFQQCLNTLVDTFGSYAASATSANTILRSLLACALPMAARPMFLNMGVGPAATILGSISCLALPVPFILIRYGLLLRKKSNFAVV